MRQKVEATYINNMPIKHSMKLHHRMLSLVVMLSMLSVIIMSGITSLTLNTTKYNNITNNIVHADDKDDMSDAADKYGSKGDATGFENTADKVWNDEKGQGDYKSWAYVINRLFSTTYMNHTENGTPSDGKSNPKWNCNKDDPYRNTPMYHNCDVPNITTEFLQKMVQIVSPMGLTNAVTVSAEVDNGFGIPSNIPNKNTVPLDVGSQGTKYTGLEVFGYSMHYTGYRGEWDNIKVLTSARTLSNFGLMDKLRLTGNVAFHSLEGGISQAAENVGNDIKQGKILSIASDAITGFFGGASAAGMNVILDTSDLNVFNSTAWYRVTYGGTLYGSRELDNTEINDFITRKFQEMISGNKKNGVVPVPKDYQDVKTPPKPNPADISKCMINNKEWGKTDKAPGVTEKACQDEAKKEKKTAKWTKDGTKKKQDLAAWKKDNQAFFDKAKAQGIDIAIDTSIKNEKDMNNALTKFYSDWDDAWKKGVAKAKDDAQKKSDDDYKEKVMDDAVKKKFFAKPENNFNAPWNRFVCVDRLGKDVQDANGNLVMAYNTKKEHNPKCNDLRPPIQNGYYGNGYQDGKGPLPDTRYTIGNRMGLINAIFDWQNAMDNLSNTLLSFVMFVTKIANSILDISFSPLLNHLGLKDKIVKWIGAFRDGVYFPLISLMMGVSAMQLLLRAGKQKDYNTGIKNLIIMVCIFFVSVMSMYAPKAVIATVDDVPSKIETAIIGTIFEAGNGPQDGLCTAGGTASTTSKGEDLNGGTLKYSPSDSVRTMECEVWRAYALTPYIAGQWGTNYNHLYSATSGKPNSFTNTNTRLVGNAGVQLGGGVTINNWGLFQVKSLATGTTTTPDPRVSTGVTSTDVYRVVDAQGGPDGGAGTYGKYFETWAGKHPTSRLAKTFVGLVAAIFGLVAIASIAILKIELSFTALVMLIFLPLILLISVQPSFGRVQAKKYIGTIISLMLQRVFLITLLGIMIKIMVGAANSSENYFLVALVEIALASVFIMKRKEMMKFVDSSVSKISGGNMVEEAKQNSNGSLMPKSVKNKINMTKAGARGAVAGAAAGFINEGTVKGAMDHSKEARTRFTARAKHRAGRRGQLGTITKVTGAVEAGKRAANSEREKNVQEFSKPNGIYSEVHKKLNHMDVNKRKLKAEQEGKPYEEKDPIKLDPRHNKDDYESLSKLDNIKKELDTIDSKRVTITTKDMRRKGKLPMTPSEIREYQERVKVHNEKIDDRKDYLQHEYDNELNSLYEKKLENEEESRMLLKDQMRRALDNLRERIDDADSRYNGSSYDWDEEVDTTGDNT